jgi:hypothetical protein
MISHFRRPEIPLVLHTLVRYNEEMFIMNRVNCSRAEHALCIQNLIQLKIFSIEHSSLTVKLFLILRSIGPTENRIVTETEYNRMTVFFPTFVLGIFSFRGVCMFCVIMCIYSFTSAYSPGWTFGLPFRSFLIVHRHTVGLLWTSDQPVAETSTYTGQHNI